MALKTPIRAREPRPKVCAVHLTVRGEAQTAHPEEFDGLVAAAGYDMVARIHYKVRTPNTATLLGTGQLEDLRQRVDALGCPHLLFNTSLEARQERHLKQHLRMDGVWDRVRLILRLFERRATTREAKLQVDMATAQYESSRLVRLWSHLERQRGGRGLRSGPGERQIEADRRQLRTRISKTKKALQRLHMQRQLSQQQRRRQHLPEIALVGYTNAGKTSLLQRLAAPNASPSPDMFATLDTCTRKLWLGENAPPCVLSDTVGFISDLPHELIAAFRSTFDHVRDATLLLIVLDASDPRNSQQEQAVMQTLRAMGAHSVPALFVANKMDRCTHPARIYTKMDSGAVGMFPVSATTGQGMAQLRQALRDFVIRG